MLQIRAGIAKWVNYYKVRQVLQSGQLLLQSGTSVITKGGDLDVLH